MSIEQKCMTALAAHEKALQAVKAMTRRIGDALHYCPVSVETRNGMATDDDMRRLFDDKQRTKTHLWRALNEVAGDGGYGERGLDAGEIDEYLAEAECPHCIEAWELIQQRKQARQQLGVQRRLIRYYGKRAMELQETGQ